FTVAARVVIGMEDVFVAKITSLWQRESNFWKIDFFTSKFSKAASIIKSAFFASSREGVLLILDKMASLSAAVIFSFFTRPSSNLLMELKPLSINSIFISFMMTLYPAWAETCAMPDPMRPEPITIIFLISIFLLL